MTVGLEPVAVLQDY